MLVSAHEKKHKQQSNVQENKKINNQHDKQHAQKTTKQKNINMYSVHGRMQLPSHESWGRKTIILLQQAAQRTLINQ